MLRRDCASGLGLLPLEQRALPFAMVRVEGQTRPPPWPWGQKRLSTLAEALPLAREIGAGSRAPREIDAGSRGCRSLWHVRSMRDHTPSGIVPWKESARMRGRRSMAHFGRAPHAETANHAPSCVSVWSKR